MHGTFVRSLWFVSALYAAPLVAAPALLIHTADGGTASEGAVARTRRTERLGSATAYVFAWAT